MLKIFLIIFTFFTSSLLFAESGNFVVLKKNQTVSDAVYEHYGSPLYGKKGWLKKILHLNSLTKHQARKLMPGRKIFFLDKPQTVATYVAPPVRVPASIEAQKVETTVAPFNQTSKIEAGLLKQFGRYDYIDKTTGSSSSLLSDFGTGFSASWKNEISDRYSFDIDYSLIQTTIQDTTASTKSVTGNKQNINDILFSFGFKAACGKYSLALGAEENLFTYATSPTEIKIEKAVIPKVVFKTEHKLISIQKISIINEFQLKYLAVGKTPHNDIDSGYAGRESLMFRREYEKFSLSSSVFIEKEWQNSNLQKQNNTQLGFLFLWGYEFQ